MQPLKPRRQLGVKTKGSCDAHEREKRRAENKPCGTPRVPSQRSAEARLSAVSVTLSLDVGHVQALFQAQNNRSKLEIKGVAKGRKEERKKEKTGFQHQAKERARFRGQDQIQAVHTLKRREQRKQRAHC